MRTVLGAAFVVALAITPAAAWECAGKKEVVATTSTSTSTPVQTAEAPAPTQTK
jgi:hypothetical protein